jgi:hypothetical protein
VTTKEHTMPAPQTPKEKNTEEKKTAEQQTPRDSRSARVPDEHTADARPPREDATEGDEGIDDGRLHQDEARP